MASIPFQLRKIDHVVLRVRNRKRMEDFYCRVLGCQLERYQEPMGMTQLRAGDALIDLIDVDGPLGRRGGAGPGVEGHNVDHICLQVDPFDRDAIVEHLQLCAANVGEFGIRFGAEGQGSSQYLIDPEGNHLELRGSAVVSMGVSDLGVA